LIDSHQFSLSMMVKVTSTAACTIRENYECDFLRNELPQKGDAPINGPLQLGLRYRRVSTARATGSA
jgi:hypothetical protein